MANMNQTDKIIYALGLGILAALAITGFLEATDLFVPTNISVPCSFRAVTGFYCPGCGGTHAVCALALGHLRESFLYHPFVPYTAACFLIFIIWNTAATVVSRRMGKSFFSTSTSPMSIWASPFYFSSGSLKTRLCCNAGMISAICPPQPHQ